MDWLRYWNDRERIADPNHCAQVEKTVRGEPVGPAQLALVVERVAEHLDLQPTDALLDLCCGNGLFARALAPRCQRVVGVDFSQPLLEVARSDGSAPNLSYVLGSILDPQLPSSLSGLGPFDKVLIYDSLEHFAPPQLEQVLRLIRAVSTPQRRALLGGVPDWERRTNFLRTPSLKLRGQAALREEVGTFWSFQTIQEAASPLGLESRRHDQPPELYNAHWRFDVTLW